MLTIPLKIPVARDAWCAEWGRSMLKDPAESAHEGLVGSMRVVEEKREEFTRECDSIKPSIFPDLVVSQSGEE